MNTWGRVVKIVPNQIHVFLLIYVIKCRLHKLPRHSFNRRPHLPNRITQWPLHHLTKIACCHCRKCCVPCVIFFKRWLHSLPTINQSGQPRRLLPFPCITCFTHTSPQVP
ncbi:hypothetical protein V8G54_021010 [Vigna mungo]|uniref:Uncharacterized protein n=1 Tax=Vigna mungo TaxID=3915 RepID=A0AAQ3NCU1_VIGMU